MIRLAEEQPRTTRAALAMEPVAIKLAGLSKTLDDRPVLQAIDLDIPAGQYIALLGANGAGKSTLLKVMALLMPPTEGAIELFGMGVLSRADRLRGRIGLIAHQAMLYRDLTAIENLVFFARLYGLNQPEARAEQMLRTVGLLDRADDPVKSFSRGMTQRVAIARALLHDPELVLADEPFAGLDVPSTRTVEGLLEDLRLQGKTVVLVNHDIAQSLRLAERVVVLRQGYVVLDGLSERLDPDVVLSEVIGS